MLAQFIYSSCLLRRVVFVRMGNVPAYCFAAMVIYIYVLESLLIGWRATRGIMRVGTGTTGTCTTMSNMSGGMMSPRMKICGTTGGMQLRMLISTLGFVVPIVAVVDHSTCLDRFVCKELSKKTFRAHIA